MEFNLIYKYLSGELDEQQTRKLFEWVSASETNRKFFAKIKNSWTSIGLNHSNIDVDLGREFELLTIRLNQEKKSGNSVVKIRNLKNSKITPIYFLYRIAAILLILYSIGGTSYYFIRNHKTDYNIISTKRGEKSSLVLSDGTKIWLNSETTLKYPADINKKTVNIYLDGEAYFNVAKNHGRKLIVNASNINIEVVGTSFNVKSYSNEETVETTLEKGTVFITADDKQNMQSGSLILKPNQQATFIKKTRKILISDLTSSVVDKVPPLNKPLIVGMQNQNTNSLQMLSDKENTKLYTAWKDGELIFKSERFEDLAHRMERWYDMQIEIKSQELKDSKYTGRFEKETIEQSLNALSLSMPFIYNIDHNKITIYKKNGT